MLKKTSSAIALLAMSFGSVAATYQVDVNLVVERAPIQIEQTTPMSFPELLVNEASKNGDGCYAVDTPFANPTASALCNDPNVGGQQGIFTVRGTPRAIVSYSYSAPDQIQDGLRFALTPFSSAVQLSAGGEASVSMSAVVMLEDKDIAINAPGTKTFTYDFVAAYQ
ncbi:hypothetical protein CWB99_01440 [Pseudoalteromonas rubra]|uniref:Uncharacterized protein n=1 Tax=Pseudoalteromonas rubra TaxID=43658 RepID=A0A5S3X1V0_9GAMM|nr:hypothetical protein [Pseudoalteromonas rubra]TMP28123.1 hypothetical protein CWC00_22165 [Pseudoalteromonas rubra]TMP32787.1 hypothetical protein CWB99_01440 [Pseudoalteromonas rubra]TMP37645.1 hypothetical protein CWB98_10740 [Pseudoalteromonas rubra]